MRYEVNKYRYCPLTFKVVIFIQFNYDNRGNALANCDGNITKLSLKQVNTILFEEYYKLI